MVSSELLGLGMDDIVARLVQDAAVLYADAEGRQTRNQPP